MKIHACSRRESGFTLAEMMIVISIIVVLAAMTIGGYNFAMKGSKRRTTEATMTAIQSSLERYFDKFGEYPEAASPDQTAEVMPDKTYRVGGAKCLYQALRGDGYDAIKGIQAGSPGAGGTAASDGNFEDAEIANALFKDMPQTMWRRVENNFIMVDGFFRPFQYVKAPLVDNGQNANNNAGGGQGGSAQTVNTTYDLWSYGDDEVNINVPSFETIKNPNLAAKWIKNW